MKLRTKIAGTLALPLALAIAGAANAAVVVDNEKHTLKIGGFVAATADWKINDEAAGQDSDIDFGMGLSTSRLNVTYTQKTSAGDISYIYENDFNGPSGSNFRLRHAAIKYDGWVAGFTWSGFANAANLAETIDLVGTTGASGNAPRVATLGKDIKVADGMTVGLFVEDNKHPYSVGGTKTKRTANTAIPDIVANYKAKFGNTNVFAAVRMVQVDKVPFTSATQATDAKTEGKVDLSLAVNTQLTDELNLKLAMVSFDEGNKVSTDGRDLAVSVAGQYKINDQIRTNLVVEQFVADADDSDYTAVWVNAFYKMESGLEWGAEVRSVSADGAPAVGVAKLNDKDMSFNLQAKYAF